MSNPAGRQLGWDFIRQHWSEVEAKLSHYSVAQMVGVGAVFCDPAKRAEFLQFFTEHKVPASERTLQLTLERIDGCARSRSRVCKPGSSTSRTDRAGALLIALQTCWE